jgi:zinc protease
MKLRIPVVLVLALLFAGFSRAAEKTTTLPKDLPPYGPLVPFHAPKAEVKKLVNGLTLWLVPRPGFPKVALVIAVRGGLASDPAARPGLSHLLMDTIDQGTRKRSAKQIAEELQAAGGDLSGFPEADYLLMATQVLASRTDASLTVLADILQNASFPASEVALAKRNAADTLRANEATPSFLAFRTLAKAMFGANPYSTISATQASITATTPEDLRREFARRFRPDQTVLVAVGDFNADAFEATVKKLLGSWKPPAQPAATLPPKPSGTNPHGVYLVSRPGSVQTTFMFGTFGPLRGAPDYAAARVANAIYGGMFGSRLILNIREDKGYTYSPGAFIQTYREAGVMVTRADVRNPVTGASLNEVDYELNRMATTSVSEDEMTHAERYLVGIQGFLFQSQESVARQLAAIWALDLPSEELGLEGERLEKVTVADVNHAARKYFPASRQTIVAVGEEKVVREQLEPFGLKIIPVAH